MEPERPSPASTARNPDPQSIGAGLRDASAIAERIATDEAAADEARVRYRTQGLPLLEPVTGQPDLAPGELLHAVHRLAMIEAGAALPAAAGPRGGTLYLTSRRLIHRGAEDTQWRLEAIGEMSVALERLLLVQLRDGSDLTIEVDQPRLLRVQVGASIHALRTAASGGSRVTRDDDQMGAG